MFDYAGAIHIHSDYSFDGRKSIDDIVASAKRCGLDFIVINDHFTLGAKKYEGWYKGVLVIVGEEISPRYNHYLAFGIDKAIPAAGDSVKPQEYIDEVNNQGGFGFIAHPDHAGNKLFKIKDYRWNDWSVKGYAGLCVWDLQNDWQITLTNYFQALLSYRFPAHYLRGPKKETLVRWDKLNRGGKFYCLGEIDNHETIKKYFGMKFKIFPFDFAFRTIRTHLVADEPFAGINADVKKVLAALKSGKCYVSNDYFMDAKNFRFFRAGDEITAQAPVESLIRIIKNGETFLEKYGNKVSFEIKEKGFYRCECYLKKMVLRPWIFSNPVFVE